MDIFDIKEKLEKQKIDEYFKEKGFRYTTHYKYFGGVLDWSNYCLTNGKIKIKVPKILSLYGIKDQFDEIVDTYEQYYKMKSL